MFTEEEREQLRDALVSGAKTDPNVSGAAHLGSAAASINGTMAVDSPLSRNLFGIKGHTFLAIGFVSCLKTKAGERMKTMAFGEDSKSPMLDEPRAS